MKCIHASVAQWESNAFVKRRQQFDFCSEAQFYSKIADIPNGMRADFYDDPGYKRKQAEITRKHWEIGTFNFLVKPLVTRKCRNPNCQSFFQVKPYETHIYCSSRCAALINNPKRITSLETKQKISQALRGKSNTKLKGIEKVPRILLSCLSCGIEIRLVPYLAKTRKYCSNICAIRVIGGQTTSPKASKGKPGVRSDIDPVICFYSTWEANTARVFNLVGLEWQYAPKLFNLGNHTYRPDFYLPQYNTFIEVKNFMGEYSLKRDSLFRQLYPDIKLEIIAKKEYGEIEENYKSFISEWE